MRNSWIVILGLVVCLAVATVSPAATYVVDPAKGSDAASGEATKPLKTLAKALELATSGDTVSLGTGSYPAVTLGKTYDKPLVISAAKGARPVMTGGVAINNAGGVRLSGLVFTWPQGSRPKVPMTPFIRITGSKDVEISDCEIFDDPKLSEWVGWVCSVSNSERITVRDTKAHHFYFGFSAYRSRNVTFRNLTIGPWTHEDGIRVTECEGPVLIEGCTISNTGVAGRKGGHVDGIQVVHWSDNLTIRNCHLSGMGQGIGAFSSGKRRRKNWHIEGNVIYDVYAPHACSVYDCDGVTVINNTFPQNRPILARCTGSVVKNNIIGLGPSARNAGDVSDYNLYIGRGSKVGEHDLVGVDPKFVNAPLLRLKSDSRSREKMTRSKFIFRESLRGRIAVGDTVDVLNSDGSARGVKPRKVKAVGDNWLEVDRPIANAPSWAGVVVYKWPAGSTNLVPDYRLKADSPAIDSADSSVKRGPDRDGHKPTDVESVANSGTGDVKYLDRGALEHVPAKAK